MRTIAEDLGGTGNWRNRNFCHVLGIDRSLGPCAGQDLVLEPGKEVGGAQIQNPLWFSVKSPLVPTWEGLGCKSHVREECEETEVRFICPHDFSPPSSLCLLRAGHLYFCRRKIDRGPTCLGLTRYKGHMPEMKIFVQGLCLRPQHSALQGRASPWTDG